MNFDTLEYENFNIKIILLTSKFGRYNSKPDVFS